MESAHRPAIALPPEQEPRQLLIFLHGAGATACSMLPVALTLRHYFPAAALLLPEGFEACERGHGRQWFAPAGIDGGDGRQRVARALPALADYVERAQRRYRLLPPDTALLGFGQGAIMALELAAAHDGLAGRVLAFSGRYVTLPERAPEFSTLHFFHGEDDPVMPVAHSNDAYARLAALGGDATLDVASNVRHELHPALVDRAVCRLQTCIPLRTWRRAL